MARSLLLLRSPPLSPSALVALLRAASESNLQAGNVAWAASTLRLVLPRCTTPQEAEAARGALERVQAAGGAGAGDRCRPQGEPQGGLRVCHVGLGLLEGPGAGACGHCGAEMSPVRGWEVGSGKWEVGRDHAGGAPRSPRVLF